MTNSLCYFQKGAECCEENTPESLIRLEYDAIDGYYIYFSFTWLCAVQKLVNCQKLWPTGW